MLKEYRVTLFRSIDQYCEGRRNEGVYKVGDINAAILYAKQDVEELGRVVGDGFARIDSYDLPYKIFVELVSGKIVVSKGRTTVDRQSMN